MTTKIIEVEITCVSVLPPMYLQILMYFNTRNNYSAEQNNHANILTKGKDILHLELL